MTNWMILAAALAVICVVAFVLEHRYLSWWGLAVGVAAAFGTLMILMICPTVHISYNSDCDVFVRQKAYIESHVPGDAAEDAALTTKKIEMNHWLFKAQYSKTHYGSWSLYPDAVMDLEPIE